MRIVRIIVDTTTRALDRALDYAVPEALGADVAVGSPVLVPLAAQQAVGYVIGFADSSPYTLRPLRAVLGPPLFDATASGAVFSAIGGIAVGDIDWFPGLEAQAWLVLLALSSQVLGWLLISVSLPRLPALGPLEKL